MGRWWHTSPPPIPNAAATPGCWIRAAAFGMVNPREASVWLLLDFSHGLLPIADNFPLGPSQGRLVPFCGHRSIAGLVSAKDQTPVRLRLAAPLLLKRRWQTSNARASKTRRCGSVTHPACHLLRLLDIPNGPVVVKDSTAALQAAGDGALPSGSTTFLHRRANEHSSRPHKPASVGATPTSAINFTRR